MFRGSPLEAPFFPLQKACSSLALLPPAYSRLLPASLYYKQVEVAMDGLTHEWRQKLRQGLSEAHGCWNLVKPELAMGAGVL